MKRLHILFAIAAAFAALSACQKPEDETPKIQYLTEIGATIEDFAVKSTIALKDGKCSWEAGDAIILSNGKASATFTYDSGKGRFTTTATDFEATGSYASIFPASIYDETRSSGSTFAVNLPAEQVASATQVKNAPMYASSKGEDLIFKHLCGVARVTVPDELSSHALAKVKLIAETNLAGRATFQKGGSSLTMDESDIAREITLDMSGVDVRSGDNAYIIVPAKMYSAGLKMTMTFKDGIEETINTGGISVVHNGVIEAMSMLIPVTAFSGGKGTESRPYLISTAEDLIQFSQLTNSAESRDDYLGSHYLQTADIDMGGKYSYVPAAQSESAPFKGIYDGGKHTISNLTINSTAAAASGLFAYATNATVKDIKLDNYSLTATNAYCGGAVGKAQKSTIEGITITGQVKQYTSGITAEGSANTGFSGGIVGEASESTVKDCVMDGNATFYGKFSGGVVGESDNSSIIGCAVAKGRTINIYYHFSGGICGRAKGADNIFKGCSFEGNFTTVGYCNGGIVGQLRGGRVEECVTGSYATIGGDKYFVGGIVGAAQPVDDITISRCATYGIIKGAYSVAGICGYSGPGTGVSSDKDLMLGANKSVTIEDCAFVGGTVTATSANSGPYSIAAGILAWNHSYAKLHLKGCYSLPGLIESTCGSSPLGVMSGIISYQNGTAGATVENCYSAFTVSDMLLCNDQIAEDDTRWYAGIHIRCTQPTTVKNCYSESSMRVGYSSAAATESGCSQYSVTEMTNGTLLAALQSTANGTTWVAGANGYPAVQGIPADPNVKKKAAKRVSVIGDSISTFKGWIPGGYSAHYPAVDGTLTLVNETYWYRLIYDYMKDAEFDKNIAFSGSTVTNTTDANYEARYGSASNAWWHNSYSERFAACGGCGKPDIILIHGGTNDWSHNADPLAPGVAIRNDATNIYGGTAPSASVMNSIFAVADAAKTRAEVNALPDGTFCEAYAKLLCQIRERYPQCKVVCIIGDYLSQSIEQSVIQVADHYGAKTVNLFRVNGFNDLGGYSPETLQLGKPQPNMPKHDHTDLNSASGCHPGSQCMKFMAEKIYNELGAWLEQ